MLQPSRPERKSLFPSAFGGKQKKLAAVRGFGVTKFVQKKKNRGYARWVQRKPTVASAPSHLNHTLTHHTRKLLVY